METKIELKGAQTLDSSLSAGQMLMNLLSCLQVTWFILAYAEACLVLFQIWSQLCISGYDNRLLSDPGTKLCCWCCDDVTQGTISHETSIIVYWLTSWFNSDLYSPELCTVVLLEGHFLSASLVTILSKNTFPPLFFVARGNLEPPQGLLRAPGLWEPLLEIIQSREQSFISCLVNTCRSGF